MAAFLKDIESGKIPLETLQQGADIDPADFKAYATLAQYMVQRILTRR